MTRGVGSGLHRPCRFQAEGKSCVLACHWAPADKPQQACSPSAEISKAQPAAPQACTRPRPLVSESMVAGGVAEGHHRSAWSASKCVCRHILRLRHFPPQGQPHSHCRRGALFVDADHIQSKHAAFAVEPTARAVLCRTPCVAYQPTYSVQSPCACWCCCRLLVLFPSSLPLSPPPGADPTKTHRQNPQLPNHQTN